VVGERLRERIRRLSAPAEFCLVLVGCSWFALFSSVTDIVTQSWTHAERSVLANDSAIALVAFELLSLALFWWIGRVRRWPFAAWGMDPSWMRVGAGAILFLWTAVSVGAIATLASAASPAAASAHARIELSVPFIALVVLINPVFEELLEAGYIVQALQRHGMWAAVLASAAFRTLLHAYQGLDALISIFPLGLIFAFVYWKWRSLWPLFIAHLIFDVYALFFYR
jgi:membrane protease YdiL (CAAX protease family)